MGNIIQSEILHGVCYILRPILKFNSFFQGPILFVMLCFVDLLDEIHNLNLSYADDLKLLGNSNRNGKGSQQLQEDLNFLINSQKHGRQS